MKTIAVTIDETTLQLLDELAAASPGPCSRSALNQPAGDSYTHAPEPECRSVRYAHETSGV